MRVLLLTPYIPCRGVGHCVASVASEFVEYFSERHELSVVTFCFRDDEMRWVGELEKKCAYFKAIPWSGGGFGRHVARLRTVFGARPFWASFFDVPAMRDEITRLVETRTFDLIQMDTVQMGQYVDALQGSTARKVLVEMEVCMRPLLRRYRRERSPTGNSHRL